MTTYLILSHRPLPHIAAHAARHPQAHYYIHHDAQSPRLTGSLTTLPNVHLISHRIRINWGGFTMIEATLALIQAALANPDTRHYHLISGSCAMKSWGVHRSPGTSTVGNLPNTTGVLATGAGMGAPWDRSRY